MFVFLFFAVRKSDDEKKNKNFPKPKRMKIFSNRRNNDEKKFFVTRRSFFSIGLFFRCWEKKKNFDVAKNDFSLDWKFLCNYLWFTQLRNGMAISVCYAFFSPLNCILRKKNEWNDILSFSSCHRKSKKKTGKKYECGTMWFFFSSKEIRFVRMVTFDTERKIIMMNFFFLFEF
jgi:hypothetical protein